MKTDTSYPTNTMLLSLLGGAIVGAIVLALTTPKTGREVRNTLKTAARRLTGKSEEPDELDTGTIEALFI
jgi:gas vesicle protein